MMINDTKNLVLALASTVITTLTSTTFRDVVSAIILPVLFFTLGKTADIVVQIYLARRRDRTKGGV